MLPDSSVVQEKP